MHKKQKITTALTVNFNKEFNRDYCERKMRIVFAKANRKLFGRRHKFIKGFGNWELTKVGNIHVHYAIACPARYMSRFVKITNDVLNEILNDVPAGIFIVFILFVLAINHHRFESP